MKKNYPFFLVICAIVFSGTASYSQQDWVKLMQDQNSNFYDIQKAFNANCELYAAKYRQANGAEPEKFPGYKPFKRWENFMEARVYPSGERFSPSIVYDEYQKYKREYPFTNAGSWTFVGPKPSVPSGGGAGRCNFIRLHPTIANTIYTGSPAGGLWKSTDNGATWITNTDQLGVIGCTDIAIDPVNPNVMYLATGDGDAGDTYSLGVLKSTNGGTTWAQTNLNWNFAQTRTISKILVNPTTTSIVLAATSAGVFRSTDSGVNWTLVQSGGFKDMEFKPADPQTVYVSGTEIYKSTDGGATWVKLTSGLPAATNVSRIAIAVTPNDPAYLYAIVGLPAPNYGTEGFYRSVNSGGTFTKPSTPSMGASPGQQWYDICLAASPTNKNEVLLGGSTVFSKSTDGGATWAGSGGSTHVDYHDVIYTSGTNCYLASDGGVWKSTNNAGAWTNISHGLYIGELYGFGQSVGNAALTLHGWQDNGTSRLNGNTWTHVYGGDGMLPFIDWNNDQNMWCTTQNGALYRSTNGGGSFSACGNIPGETGAWVTPWLQDPTTAGTIYAGKMNVWKSTNGGVGWTKISAITTGTLNVIAVSPATSQVLWAAKAGALYKTNNGGTNWTTISTLPPGFITGITCHNTDANKAWVTFSGFNGKNKVFQTNDQGATWINLSNSLPNIPVNCIEFMNGSNDGLYIGTDLGVYYRDASLSVWQPFSSGLPNVVVTQLMIHYGSSKIRASTYGRAMWESGFYVPGAYAPVANFSSQGNIACPGAAVQFYDQSSGPPTSWSWSFTGGSPATSAQQNPIVTYNNSGTYPVTLIVSNAGGADTVSYTSYVTVSTSPVAAPLVKNDQICAPGTVNLSATGNSVAMGGVLRWWNAPGGGSVVSTGPTYSPTISSTTTYYVDEGFPAAADDYTGPTDNTMGAGAMFAANDIRGLYFDVLTPVILKSVDVYSNSAGKRTIEVQDATGTIMDTTLNIPASPTTLTTVPLNFKLYPGTGYFIKCNGLVDLYRNNLGSVFPYTSNSINITGTNAGSSGYYYFFYNWIYAPIQCNTSRTPVTGFVGCTGLNDDRMTNGTMNIHPNPSNGKFDLSFHINEKDNYAIRITNTLGQTVYGENMNNFSGSYSGKVDISGYGKGVYMLSLTNSKNETVKRVIVY